MDDDKIDKIQKKKKGGSSNSGSGSNADTLYSSLCNDEAEDENLDH